MALVGLTANTTAPETATLAFMATALTLFAYLDPGDDPSPTWFWWQWVLLAAVLIVLLLVALYALTRFVAWAARR